MSTNYLHGLTRTVVLEPDAEPLSADPVSYLYDALLAGKPPGKLLLMLEGDRPVVNVSVWRKTSRTTTPNEITHVMREIGERADAMTWVLWPLDITRKLASESDLLQFEFPAEIDLTQRKWK